MDCTGGMDLLRIGNIGTDLRRWNYGAGSLEDWKYRNGSSKMELWGWIPGGSVK